jgi:hypothetical protein
MVHPGLSMPPSMWSQICERAARMEISASAWLRIAITEKLARDYAQDH